MSVQFANGHPPGQLGASLTLSLSHSHRSVISRYVTPSYARRDYFELQEERKDAIGKVGCPGIRL